MTEEAEPTAVAGLRADGVRFDERDAQLLRAIARTGSVSAAAAELGRSRARALTRLEEVETAFGSLVVRQRGGSDGGGSRLTTDGETLLARFARLRATLAGTAAAGESVLSGEVTAIIGETATVETAAGTVSAVIVEPADASDADELSVGSTVEVTVRADAVTLETPDATETVTSARNRFEGVVRRVDRGDALVETVVGVGDETIRAVVTADSADRLQLGPDRPIVVSFKATATRAVPTLDSTD